MSYMDTSEEVGVYFGRGSGQRNRGYDNRGGWGRGYGRQDRGGYQSRYDRGRSYSHRNDRDDNYRSRGDSYRGRSDSYRGRGDSYRGGNWGGRSSSYNSRGGNRRDPSYTDDRRRKDNYDYYDQRPRNNERAYFPFRVFLNLQGHTQIVTAILLDEKQNKIYSGSKDGSLRIWNMEGQCESVLDAGGSVTYLYMEGGFVFAAANPAQNSPGIIRVWSMASGAEMDLHGHEREVLCLTAARSILISGGRDAAIRFWGFDQQNSVFKEQGCLKSGQGGHTCAVQCLAVENQYLMSGDWQGIVKVWDLESLSALQTIKAHDNVLMGLLVYKNQHLLTASLDGSVKVFKLTDTTLPGQVFESLPEYSHPPAGPGQQSEYGGILAMAGMLNNEGNPILAVSHDQEGIVRMWGLPDFVDEGQARAWDCHAIAVGNGLVAVGHDKGQIQVFQWK
eukprot:TRINITY_DN54069_c0_g1_i1.p1 TRINITY_DN54069_c0_g1~~TRINITY_DN54069_c0_g1_i1.p1  ORF type:complete len:481 (-),score=66.18 TRINITY_DN54069_c0_g1_i1:404-1744(-)